MLGLPTLPLPAAKHGNAVDVNKARPVKADKTLPVHGVCVWCHFGFHFYFLCSFLVLGLGRRATRPARLPWFTRRSSGRGFPVRFARSPLSYPSTGESFASFEKSFVVAGVANRAVQPELETADERGRTPMEFSINQFRHECTRMGANSKLLAMIRVFTQTVSQRQPPGFVYIGVDSWLPKGSSQFNGWIQINTASPANRLRLRREGHEDRHRTGSCVDEVEARDRNVRSRIFPGLLVETRPSLDATAAAGAAGPGHHQVWIVRTAGRKMIVVPHV